MQVKRNLTHRAAVAQGRSVMSTIVLFLMEAWNLAFVGAAVFIG